MRLGLISLLLLTACEPPGPSHFASPELRACAAMNDGRLTTISAAVARVNTLPPSSPACFLASLTRPLSVVASTSITSAQPAVSRESPRLFLLDAALAISLVPEGDGAHLVEFSEWLTPTRTLKGELVLPRTGTLGDDAPYTHLRFNSPATTCGLCHREETPHPTIPGAHVSLAFRPSPRTLVPLSELLAAHEQCTRDEDPSERCAMFHALFDFGVVRAGAFSTDVALFAE